VFVQRNLVMPTILQMGNGPACAGSAPVLTRQCHFKMYAVSQKKLCKLISCQNFVKFRPIAKMFGTEIAKRTSFSEVYLFSTSPNLCQRTTVLNADVPNCYITQ